MEDRDLFTLRHRGVLLWLAGVLVGSVSVAAIVPPSFWLSAVGFAFLAAGVIAHSARTGQWYTWQRWEPRFNWFEGWAAATGVVLFLVPFLVVLFLGAYAG
jgi:hypothetical protein